MPSKILRKLFITLVNMQFNNCNNRCVITTTKLSITSLQACLDVGIYYGRPCVGIFLTRKDVVLLWGWLCESYLPGEAFTHEATSNGTENSKETSKSVKRKHTHTQTKVICFKQ